MKPKTYMTISEFAHITGIKRANLIFYDNIGLLSPEFRGDNDYRYYTRQQLSSAYIIITLRELGLSLDTIRHYASERTPEKMLLLFDEQKKRIDKEVTKLRRTKDMLGIYTDMAQEGILWNSEEITLREKKKEPIFLGPPTDPSKNDDDNSIDFYRYASEEYMELGYPLGCVVRKQVIETWFQREEQRKHTSSPEAETNNVYRYYFKVKQGQNAYKPQGLYAAACGYCGYGETHYLYERLMRFISEKELMICGDAYEESLLNEMAVAEDDRYFFRVEMPVEERNN